MNAIIRQPAWYVLFLGVTVLGVASIASPASASGGKILLISARGDDPNPGQIDPPFNTHITVGPLDVIDPSTTREEQSLITFLEGLGHTVDTRGMARQFRSVNETDMGPLEDPDRIAAIEEADLILFSRVNSVSTQWTYFEGSAFATPKDRRSWNELEKPILNMNGGSLRSTNPDNGHAYFGWNDTSASTTGGQVGLSGDVNSIEIVSGEEAHPFVSGFAGPIVPFDFSAAPGGVAPDAGGTVVLPDGPLVPEGTVVATYDGSPILIDIPAGTDFDQGGFEFFGVSGERRVFLAPLQYGFGSASSFTNWLSPDYLNLLEAVIDDMIGVTGPAGDFDADGDVDGADFLEWQREMGDATSLGEWEANFGTTAAVAATVGVPEPASWVLLRSEEHTSELQSH